MFDKAVFCHAEDADLTRGGHARGFESTRLGLRGLPPPPRKSAVPRPDARRAHRARLHVLHVSSAAASS